MEDTISRWNPAGFEVTHSENDDELLINGMRMQEASILNWYPVLWNVICSVIMDIDSMTPKQVLAEHDEVFDEMMESANMISLTLFDDNERSEFLSFNDALAILRDEGRLPPCALLEAVLIAWSFGMCIELGLDDNDDDDDDGERHPGDLVTEGIMRRAASTAFVLCQSVFTRRTGAILEALRVFVFNARASHSRCNQVTRSLNASMDSCLDKMSEAVSALHLLANNTALSQ